jgi:hypothetical protein
MQKFFDFGRSFENRRSSSPRRKFLIMEEVLDDGTSS